MADCENDEPLKITLSAGSGSVPTFCELVLRIAWDSGILGIPRIVRVIVIVSVRQRIIAQRGDQRMM